MSGKKRKLELGLVLEEVALVLEEVALVLEEFVCRLSAIVGEFIFLLSTKSNLLHLRLLAQLDQVDPFLLIMRNDDLFKKK